MNLYKNIFSLHMSSDWKSPMEMLIGRRSGTKLHQSFKYAPWKRKTSARRNTELTEELQVNPKKLYKKRVASKLAVSRGKIIINKY